jgi:UDP-N-acetylmuramate dehydrogenase
MPAMDTRFTLHTDYSLRQYNTLGIDAKAERFVSIESIEQLRAVLADPVLAAMPRLLLGGGSNLVLPDMVPGLVLKLDLRGRQIVGEDEHATHVRAAAGENWHSFVLWTLEQGCGGLENLSLIPGTVGAAPIQNIGAYGVEMQDVFHSLSAYDFETGQIITLDKAACRFAYRDSVFKQEYKDRMLILDVSFALPKRWTSRLAYADVANYLIQHGVTEPTPAKVSDAVIAIRQAKLPDPAVIGNAGSFFKNPIVPASERERLLQAWPKLVSYAQPDGAFKLAAGWLIEQAGWKGKDLGRAGMYEKQALVLVNRGGASGAEVRALAQQVQQDVQAKFGVILEAEPVFV